MKEVLFILSLLVISALVSSCSSTGVMASGHVTNIQLDNGNFRMVATSIAGEASSAAILGVSYGFGVATTQMALVPLNDDRRLYQSAIKKLWANFEAAHGKIENRKLALINVRYDAESLDLFFYTKATAVIVADVIEFE